MEPNPRPLAPRIVLDTNVVLDWLLFDDSSGREVGRAVSTGALQWIGTEAMQSEHLQVVSRKALAHWSPDVGRHRAAWAAHCLLVPAPVSPPRDPWLRCTDPDDQIFVDLAAACRPRWLLSRDTALLRLAAPLRRFGVEVMTPAAWLAAAGAAQPGAKPD